MGSGIIGLATAWHLSMRGRSVLVIDQETPTGSASRGNAGILSLGHPPLTQPGASIKGLRWMFNRNSPFWIRPRLDPKLLQWLLNFHRHCRRDHLEACMPALSELGAQSIGWYEQMVRDHSIDCHWDRRGWLDVCRSEPALEQARRTAEMLKGHGFDSTVLENGRLQELDPAYRDDLAGAVRYEDSATMDPSAFLHGLEQACRDRGVRFDHQARLERVQLGDHAISGIHLEDGRNIACSSLLIAAGIWSSQVASSIGVNIPMQAARGYHLQLRLDSSMPCIGSVLNESCVAVTPMGDQLRLAGTLEITSINAPISRRRLDQLVRAASLYIRDIDGATREGEWAGLRPCTWDGIPVIGGVPWIDGLFIATGHAMMGMTLGPATGRVMADLLTGTDPGLDLSMFTADRFGRA